MADFCKVAVGDLLGVRVLTSTFAATLQSAVQLWHALRQVQCTAQTFYITKTALGHAHRAQLLHAVVQKQF